MHINREEIGYPTKRKCGQANNPTSFILTFYFQESLRHWKLLSFICTTNVASKSYKGFKNGLVAAMLSINFPKRTKRKIFLEFCLQNLFYLVSLVVITILTDSTEFI